MASAPPDRARLALRLPAKAASVTQARHAAREFAREVGAEEDDVGLAVTEAVSNAVVHGFRDRDRGTVEISAEVADGRLVLTVADDGVGMAPDLDHSGLGLGLALISRLTAEVTFSSSATGTKVSMAFVAERTAAGSGAMAGA